MKFFYSILIIFQFFIIQINNVNANAFHSGSELSDICFNFGDFSKQSYCLGFIIGVASDLHSQQRICLPRNVAGDKIRDFVLAFISKNQDLRGKSATILITESLKIKYPCKKQ